MNIFTSLFKKPSAMSMAQLELEDNKRNLLQHESHALYSTKMAEYHRENILRLTEYIDKANTYMGS